MVSESPNTPRRIRYGVDDLILRELSGGTVRHVIHDAGDTITAGEAPEIFLRIAGRGRIDWQDAPSKDRSGAAILVPSEQTLRILGKVRALRVTLPGLAASTSTGPLSEVLISLLCPRAWHAPEPIAQASLALIRLLVEEDVRQRSSEQGEGSRRN